MLYPPSPQLWANRTVGLLGGSFNPAHLGHRHISLYALKLLGLDAVWWMVSPQNPLKSSKDMWPLAKRIKSATEVSRHPRILVTDIETTLKTQYTVDTLKELKKRYPTTRFIWLMGADNMRQFHRWKNWQDIYDLLPIAVLDRPPRGSSIKSCPAYDRYRNSLKAQENAQNLSSALLPAWTILHIPLNSLSATQIREKRKLQ